MAANRVADFSEEEYDIVFRPTQLFKCIVIWLWVAFSTFATFDFFFRFFFLGGGVSKRKKKVTRYMGRILKEHNAVKMFAFFLSHTFPEADVKKMTGKCERFIVKYRYRMARYCMGPAWDKVVASCKSFR